MHAGHATAGPGASVCVTLVYDPAGHCSGASLPEGQYDPAGHAVHCPGADKLVAAVHVPGGHGNSVASTVLGGQ